MTNWYEILGISEGVRAETLKKLRTEKRFEHHPDRHENDPPETREWHTEQFELWEEGMSFLLNETTRDELDQHLKTVRAAVQREEIRRRNEEEARRRGDADGLRAQFGSRPRPASGARPRRPPPPRSGSGVRPSPQRPAPPRPPTNMPRSPISEAGVVLALDELPPIDWGGARAVAGRLIALVAATALLALPFCIVSAVGESNEYGLVLLGCVALFVVGLAAVACTLGAIFSRD
jgi:curved DNA-binding protein CbpA